MKALYRTRQLGIIAHVYPIVFIANGEARAARISIASLDDFIEHRAILNRFDERSSVFQHDALAVRFLILSVCVALQCDVCTNLWIYLKRKRLKRIVLLGFEEHVEAFSIGQETLGRRVKN